MSDFSKVDWEEVIRITQDYKYKKSECQHSPVRELINDKERDYDYILTCPDCGETWWMVSKKIYTSLMGGFDDDKTS